MKSGARRPLQPLNGLQLPESREASCKPNHETLEDKENLPFDSSLAQELTAFKKKLLRLREDHQRTEQLLKQRDLTMDLHMKHLLDRADFQKKLEIEVDRLFRLKELYAYSSKISPIRTLREREQERRNCSGPSTLSSSNLESIFDENVLSKSGIRQEPMSGNEEEEPQEENNEFL